MSQSGTFPKVFTDFSPEAVEDQKQKLDDIITQALEVDCGVPVTSDATRMWRLLGGLGSHDLSAMREALGMPQAVVGASLGSPFWKYDLVQRLLAPRLIKPVVSCSNTLDFRSLMSLASTIYLGLTHISKYIVSRSPPG